MEQFIFLYRVKKNKIINPTLAMDFTENPWQAGRWNSESSAEYLVFI